MKIRIIQGGQTGVDRGAWMGAGEAGLDRGGWMPHDLRDECGLIPDEVRRGLTICQQRGYPARTRANVFDADLVLLVVADSAKPDATRGTALTIRIADDLRRRWVATNGHDLALAVELVSDLVRRAPLKFPSGQPRPCNIMVAGPRASIWPDGEETARRVMMAIAGMVTP